MRILHLASSHRWTGAAEPASDLAFEQMQLGHDVEFACVEGHSFWRRLIKKGIPAVGGFEFNRIGPNFLSMLGDVRRLRALIAERRYDVVHAHLAHDHWLAGLAVTGSPFGASVRREGRPILVRTLHRDEPPRADPLHRWLFASATDLLIVVSRSARESVMRRLGLDERRVKWVRGAVDTDRFRPDLDPLERRREWRIPDDAPVAGIVARMQPHRGHAALIETIDEVAARVPNAIYLIAGRGEEKKRLRAMMKAHPKREHFRDVGYVKHGLPEAYAAMNVSTLLALGSDGTCRAMLEAMACGRPVIGIRRGAVADTIEPGATGWLIDPDNLREELTRALIEALADPGRTAEMGRAARASIEAHFTQRRRAEAVLAGYEAALK